MKHPKLCTCEDCLQPAMQMWAAQAHRELRYADPSPNGHGPILGVVEDWSPPVVPEPERWGHEPEPVPDDVPSRWSVMAADVLARQRYRPLTYLVPELLPQGGLALLAGAPKSGKSMLALGLSLAVAGGSLALGKHPTRQGNVLYVTLDDQSLPRMKRRLTMLSQGTPLPGSLGIQTAPIGRGHMAVASLDEYLREHTPTLVVLDTVEHLRPDKRPGQGTYSHDVDFLTQLRGVCDMNPETTLLCLAHTRKPMGDDEDNPITAVSGTHGVTGGADHVLVLTGKHGVPRRILDVVSRDDDTRRHVLNFTATGFMATGEDPDDPTLMLTKDNGAVYRALKAYGQQGATAVELEAECPNVVKMGNRLAALTQAGLVRKLARGRYATTTP